jgi:hypothetical protein
MKKTGIEPEYPGSVHDVMHAWHRYGFRFGSIENQHPDVRHGLPDLSQAVFKKTGKVCITTSSMTRISVALS